MVELNMLPGWREKEKQYQSKAVLRFMTAMAAVVLLQWLILHVLLRMEVSRLETLTHQSQLALTEYRTMQAAYLQAENESLRHLLAVFNEYRQRLIALLTADDRMRAAQICLKSLSQHRDLVVMIGETASTVDLANLSSSMRIVELRQLENHRWQFKLVGESGLTRLELSQEQEV